MVGFLVFFSFLFFSFLFFFWWCGGWFVGRVDADVWCCCRFDGAGGFG